MIALILRSLKSWKREKGIWLIAVAALSLGIGSATAIFTIVDAVLLKPLPYSQGDRWFTLLAGDTRDPNHFSGLSFAECAAYQEQMHSLSAFGCFPVGGDFNLTAPGQPRHIDGIDVSPALLEKTGVRLAAGRFFAASDGPDVAVISERLFLQLGRGIIGHNITLNGHSYLVVGALPQHFRMPVATVFGQNSQNDVWIPLKRPLDEDHARNYAYYQAYAKLKAGVPAAQAKAEALRIASQLGKQNHPNDPAYTAAFFSLQESVVKPIRPILLLLFGASGFLMLITCSNVAGLLVSRSVGRARETAIRVALGARQSQLALQYFLESLWVSLAAAVIGVLLSVLFVRILVSLAAEYIPRSDEVTTDWTATGFALALAFLAATLSALAPLWQAFRTEPNEILTDGVRASAGFRSRKISRSLVVAEIALAFTLICTGALFLWQLGVLHATSPGFNPNGLMTFKLTRAGTSSADSKQTAAYSRKLLEALEAIPGVSDASVANQIPLAGCCLSTSLFPQGDTTGSEITKPVSLMVVSASYFKTLGIPLRSGRLLTVHDTNENLLPVVIDEAAASRYWPRRSALGAIGRIGNQNGSQVQVVGIVGTVPNQGLGKAPMPEIYVIDEAIPLDPIHVVVRSNLSPANAASAIRRAVAQVDAAQPIYGVESMEQILSGSLIFERIESIVITFFALAALVMACLGIYGLTAYSVQQRTTEMGTRMALGATGNQLLRMIAADGLRLACYGILIGGALSAGATHLIEYYLSVNGTSALPYVVAIIIVLALSLLSSLVPAWRASILSPLVAIRSDSESIWSAAQRALKQATERLSPAKAETIDTTLLTEFIEAGRKADSFTQLFQVFIRDLQSKIHAGSVILLEKISPGEFRCVAAVPANVPATVAIPENGFLLNRLHFYGSPMSFAAADLETSRRWAFDQKPQQVGELELLETLGLRLAAPLRTRKELIGLLLFGAREDGVDYHSSEKQLVAVCAEQFSLTLENARLNERLLEQEKVRRDVALATEVQKRLLPEDLPQTALASFGAYTLAARSVGGDYYDFLQIGDQTIGIALADVAGKGIAAALIMAVVQASLRIIAAEDNISLPQLAAKMNRFLHRSTSFSGYATFFYAQLDGEKRQLRYVNAGHNPPYLIRAGSSGPCAEIEELATGGIVIGMFPAASYEEATVNLQDGDMLLAFTDGVTEAMNPADEEYGEDRLKGLVRRLAHLSISEITSGIAQELRSWIAEAPQHDDLTFIIMKVGMPD